MQSEYPISLELQRRPPRNTQNKQGKWGDVFPYLIFLVPHIWIALIAPFVLVGLYCNVYLAEPFPGTVTALQTYHTKKGTTTRGVNYNFKVNDKTFKGQNSVSSSTYETLHEGGPVTVYALRAMPWTQSRVEKYGDFGMLAFATLWVLGWCTGCFVLTWSVLAQPRRSKRLVRDGIAIIGTLSDVTEKQGRSSKIYGAVYTYEFKQIDKKTGRSVIAPFKGKMKINKKDYQLAKDTNGQPVNVLIDENNPKKSIVYQFCDHVAVR